MAKMKNRNQPCLDRNSPKPLKNYEDPELCSKPLNNCVQSLKITKEGFLKFSFQIFKFQNIYLKTKKDLQPFYEEILKVAYYMYPMSPPPLYSVLKLHITCTLCPPLSTPF